VRLEEWPEKWVLGDEEKKREERGGKGRNHGRREGDGQQVTREHQRRHHPVPSRGAGLDFLDRVRRKRGRGDTEG